MKLKKNIKALGIIAYIAFIIFSIVFGFNPGVQVGKNFIIFSLDMLKVLPCAFVLIGLFEVWIKKRQ